MSLSLWPKILAINVGFSRPCGPMPLEFLPCFNSIFVAFLLGNKFVHVQVVPGSFTGCPLSTKQNFIKSYW